MKKNDRMLVLAAISMTLISSVAEAKNFIKDGSPCGHVRGDLVLSVDSLSTVCTVKAKLNHGIWVVQPSTTISVTAKTSYEIRQTIRSPDITFKIDCGGKSITLNTKQKISSYNAGDITSKVLMADGLKATVNSEKGYCSYNPLSTEKMGQASWIIKLDT